MSNPDWGVKRLCPETGKRFYDLNKTPIVSPYTGKVVTLDSPDRRDDSTVAALKAKSKAAVEDDDDLLVDDDDDAVEVSDELLEDDDEDTVALDDLTDVASNDDD
ncbi:MAG: TIGR02300 family protein [Rhodobacteraceae bacterium]|nr:MAG: TIGR02300 family protein [Paracoccaceae bacterium]